MGAKCPSLSLRPPVPVHEVSFIPLRKPFYLKQMSEKPLGLAPPPTTYSLGPGSIGTPVPSSPHPEPHWPCCHLHHSTVHANELP